MSGNDMTDPTRVQPNGQPSPRELEALQEIIIKAHYLAMELRYVCANSGVGQPQMHLAASHMLKSWALAFADALGSLAPNVDDA